jgi:hypothetical protein
VVVLILLLDNGDVITGGGQIVSWARSNAPARTLDGIPRRDAGVPELQSVH